MTRASNKLDGPIFTQDECETPLTMFLKNAEVNKLSRQLRKDVEKMYNSLELFYNAIDLTAYRRNLLKSKTFLR